MLFLNNEEKIMIENNLICIIIGIGILILFVLPIMVYWLCVKSTPVIPNKIQPISTNNKHTSHRIDATKLSKNTNNIDVLKRNDSFPDFDIDIPSSCHKQTCGYDYSSSSSSSSCDSGGSSD